MREFIQPLPPDSPLPPERALSERFGVSRETLRKALAELADAGLVYTIHGAGTFVALPSVTKRLKLLSFSEEIRNRGWVPTTELISADRINLMEVREGGDFEIIDESTLKIVRLRLGNNEPLSHETTYISESVAPGLLDHNLTESLYSILKTKYGVKIHHADEQIRPIVVDKAMASLLNLKAGDPAFEIKRSAYTPRGILVERSLSIRRGDRWSFNYSVKA